LNQQRHIEKLSDQQHTLFAVTDFKLDVFSVNFGLGYGLTPASDRFVIKTIFGVRNADYEFIVNPIVDIGFGKYGEADFAPAARFARKLNPDLFVGLEYYSDFGEIGRFGNSGLLNRGGSHKGCTRWGFPMAPMPMTTCRASAARRQRAYASLQPRR
jgi:hypothetical protein